MTIMAYSQQPKPQPIKCRGVEHLSDMLVHYNQVVVHSIRLARNSTVGDVTNYLKTKLKLAAIAQVELSHPNAEFRLLEVFYHKIYKIFLLGEKIENINDQYWTLHAEEIPEEERNLGPHDRLIHVYHFMKDPNQNQMWKFAFVVMNRPEYLQDSDIVSGCFQRRDVYGAWEQYLGLEHSDTTPKRAYTANQNRHIEKPVKIFN